MSNQDELCAWRPELTRVSYESMSILPPANDNDDLLLAVATAGDDGAGAAWRPPGLLLSSGVRLGKSILTLNTCTVALSLLTANHFESGEKAMQWMSAPSVPLLSYNKSQEHQHVNKTKFQYTSSI